MSRGKRRAALVAAPLVVVALAGATAYAVTSGDDEVGLRTATVGLSTVREVVEAPGQVVARASVTVTSPADGTVAEVAVDGGTNVEVGDLLVVLAD